MLKPCKLWTGRVGSNGYGWLQINGKKVDVARYYWKRKNGAVPEGARLARACKNKLCIEPTHMKLKFSALRDMLELLKANIDTEECFVWSVGKRSSLRIGDKNYGASRLAWTLAYSVDPGEIQVLHTCDNGTCINPKHLFLGTQKDNIQDMWAKGRSGLQRHGRDSKGRMPRRADRS